MRRLIIAALMLVAVPMWALEPEHSGAWFDIDDPGHGISVHAWDSGAAFWWFAHGPRGGIWFMGQESGAGQFILYWPQSYQFPVAPGGYQMIDAGTATLTSDGDNLVLEWDIFADCGLTASPVPPWCGVTIDSQGVVVLHRLTPE